MTCFHPLEAFRPIPGSGDGSLLFSGRNYDSSRRFNPDPIYGAPISVPCGQCIDCRVEHSRQWAIRCMHEASLYEDNCFVTLTYDDDNLPKCNSLVPRDLQLFMKRLRKFFSKERKINDVLWPSRTVRFYGCGEYGDRFGRPHYHILLFNADFLDKSYWRQTPSGNRQYRSAELEKLWSREGRPIGNCEIGSVSFESAAYVARYCVKKVTGDKANEHYHCYDDEGRSFYRVPEFGRMSNKPGIGQPWLDKFHTDVYNQDFVLVRGKKMRPPKFYDEKYSFMYPSEFENIEFERKRKDWLAFRDVRKDNVPARLAVKEEIAAARLSNFAKRNFE